MIYVDDTTLIASEEEKLQKLVDIVKECSSNAGLDMNAKKTKTMIISKTPDSEKKVNITIEGESLEQVQKFKYLGTQVTEDARSTTELNCRIGAAKTKFSIMSTILTSKQLSIAYWGSMSFMYESIKVSALTPSHTRIETRIVR